ncbi:MAG: hypothetical protein Q9171_003493 [Xanthocarpia ochracea]
MFVEVWGPWKTLPHVDRLERDSKICYAYLADVDEAVEDIAAPDSPFRNSRWFTRGWTLQELLAPKRLGFFNGDWQFIGERRKDSRLSEVVSEITSIQPAFLEGLDLRKANIALKMSWASDRITTRKEDMAYCLLGIFDVNMPLLYGEGSKAFARLQEEIVRRTYDHSLLAWGLLPWDRNHSVNDTEPCGILATSVVDFAACGSLCICTSLGIYGGSSDEHEMTSQGLRVQLPLRGPRTRQERKDRRYIAIVNCFSRKEPSRRIGIPLQRVPGLNSYTHYTQVKDGDVFRRIGRALLFSEIGSDAIPTTEYDYVSKTIHIAVTSDVVRDQPPARKREISIVDIPAEYRYDVMHVHPWYKLEKDRYTVNLGALRISRRPLREMVREMVAADARSPHAEGFIEHCSDLWALCCSILTNILELKSPLSKIRVRPSSVILCIKLTRENYVKLSREDRTLRRVETPAFLAFIVRMPQRPGSCRLAPLPRDSSHMQSEFSDWKGLIGHKTLAVGNETFTVHNQDLMDVWNPGWLIKIDVKRKPARDVSVGQQMWTALKLLAWYIHHCRYVLGTLAAYAVVTAFLSAPLTSGKADCSSISYANQEKGYPRIDSNNATDFEKLSKTPNE